MPQSQSQTRTQYPLSPKKIIKKTILGTIGWLILFLLFGGGAIWFIAASANTGNPVFPQLSSIVTTSILILVIALILITVIQYIYQVLYFKAYFYDFTDSFIIIRKGVIAPREISIPYERVQDVYVDQDIWDRLFGLYDVHLSTATFTSGMEAHIDGVEKTAADGLRAVLLKTIGEKIHTKPSMPPSQLPGNGTPS